MQQRLSSSSSSNSSSQSSGEPRRSSGGRRLVSRFLSKKKKASCEKEEEGRRKELDTDENRRALLSAAARGDLALAKNLVSMGVDARRARDSKGNSVLHRAAKKGYLELIEYFLKHTNINLEILNKAENTPLHIAAWSDNLKIVKFLISEGADINPKSYNGSVPLHMAAVTGYTEVVKYLISASAHVNSVADNGRLPIHSAARKGQLQIVQHLVNHGALLYARDIEGLDALDVALLGKHIETATYLTEIYRDTAIDGLEQSGWWWKTPPELLDIILCYAIPERPHPLWKEAPQEVKFPAKMARHVIKNISQIEENNSHSSSHNSSSHNSSSHNSSSHHSSSSDSSSCDLSRSDSSSSNLSSESSCSEAGEIRHSQIVIVTSFDNESSSNEHDDMMAMDVSPLGTVQRSNDRIVIHHGNDEHRNDVIHEAGEH